MANEVENKLKPKHYWIMPAIKNDLISRYLSQIDKISSLNTHDRSQFIAKLIEIYGENISKIETPSQLNSFLSKKTTASTIIEQQESYGFTIPLMGST